MYTPSNEVLKNYAKVMVRYAIANGKGIRPGETVFLNGMESTKPLFEAIHKEIILAGGNVITQYLADSVAGSVVPFMYQNASDEQLSYFPEAYWRGIVDSCDHVLSVISYPDIHVLEGIASEKISLRSKAFSKYMAMRKQKEEQGKMSWTLCLYGTQSSADEAGMTLEEYWEQIIEACYLREADPVARWQQTQQEINAAMSLLDAMDIQKVHIQGDDADLHVTIGESRKWLGGTGQNIPSFEIFITPDWRGTNGWIRFNQPLYYVGKRISGIRLEFKDGLIVSATADENEDVLLDMISKKNANKIGEFSMTDRRHTHISKFMANTLFDENTAGTEGQGNTHIAMGNGYRTAYTGNINGMTAEQWEALGINNCPEVHVDVVSTTRRTITATLRNGDEVVIYDDGEFTFI